ncbi:MAG: ABC transporter ATP-binding protein [Chloroflexi bacterium]|nr:ABC transporter ATP-binding protein [Chloroflexota bacterium]
MNPSGNDKQPILEARNLSKEFHTGGAFTGGTVKAVQGASFKLYRGHVVALVGESGSGKSTIVRMLARLYDPTEGDILYEGENVLEQRGRRALLDYRSKVQMVFQDPFSSLNPVHRASHAVHRPLKIYDKARGRGALRQKLIELFELVSLTPADEFIEKYPHQLSGGQRQRIAIARALAAEPEVILADEPVSMLDVSIRLGILNLMADLREKQGIGFLYVTHDLASARYFSDEILVMYAGYIVEQATSEELISNPKHPYTQMLLAAVPDPSRGLKTEDADVQGEIPDLTDLGSGCPFAPRCKHVMDVCHEAMPGPTRLEDERWVRCYLYEEGVPVA